jgi:hypothetical protein
VILGAYLAAPSVAQEPDAWQILERLRVSLTDASPLEIGFSQTFTPSGFSTGDTEGGALFLNLPACARWDYSEPFPRSYLLCENVAYSWNPGERSGRRFEITDAESEGLDLLRLNVADARLKYEATSRTSEVAVEIHLVPLTESATIVEATFEMSSDQDRLISLSFVDGEGNRTVFDLGEHESLNDSTFFSPPSGIEWLER